MTAVHPVPRSRATARARAQCGMGTYRLSGGAIWTAPTAISPEHNLHPGTVDCSGLVAYVLEYERGRWNCNAILEDALNEQRMWVVVHHGEPVLPGDVVVHAGPDLNHDGIPDPGGHGHTGVVVKILPGFLSLRETPELMEVAHSSGRLQLHTDPATGKPYGTVRVTGAEPWMLAGYVVRAKHLVGG